MSLDTATVADQRPGMKAFSRRLGHYVVLPPFFDLTIVGAHRVPATGAVLLASNHVSLSDGPVLFVATPRFTSFMVKSEAFVGPIGTGLRAIGQIPVHRDIADRNALMQALTGLRDGAAVGMFPEGTRTDGSVGGLRRGLAWLALRSAAPVVPVAIVGTYRRGHKTGKGRAKVLVSFGNPVRPVEAPAAAKASRVSEVSAGLQPVLAAHVTEARRAAGVSASGEETRD